MIHETTVVPRAFYKFLDHTTASLFLRDPYMREFVLKTYSAGIQRIGTLVQMAEDEVFRVAPTSPNNREKIRRELAAAGLHFGMTAPGWKDPDNSGSPGNGRAHAAKKRCRKAA
jgi:hypothetical protein